MSTNDVERRLALAESFILGPDDFGTNGLGRVRLKPHAVDKARRHPEFFGTCAPATGLQNAYCRVCGEWLKWDVPRQAFLFRWRIGGPTDKGFIHERDCRISEPVAATADAYDEL
jgi:hypothetical protein